MALPIVNELGQEFESVEAFNNLLIKGRDAQYLLTPHMFHGGVHLSDESVPWGCDRAPVRCIADGEVVAYRMMKQYLTSEYQGEQLRYSNSFCLVRHRYQETTPEGEKREFRYYSLYMHLRPMEEYPQANRYRLKQPRRVRHSVPSADFQPPTLTLKAGEEFELVEGVARQRGVVEGQGEFEFARIKILTAGGSSAEVLATEGMDNLWLAMDEHAIEPAFTVKRPSWIYDQVEAVVTENMVGRADPLGRKGVTGYPLAGGGSYSVAKGSLIQFSAHEVEWQEVGGKARQMARCRVVPMAKTVWLCVEAQNIEIKRHGTSTLDKLYTLPKPVAIKGGDVIGYLGRYEGPETRFGGRNEEHLVHLEVFSDDPKVETIVGSGRWQEAGYKLVKGDSHGALVKPVPDFFGELYRACDLDKDGELSAEEIWAGLKNKRTADGLFKIVAEHNSEWWAPASKAMLDQFAVVEKEPEEALLRAHEQERVQKLSWMDKPEVRRLGFSGPKVWFFYPMALEVMKRTLVTIDFDTSLGVYRISQKSADLILKSEGYQNAPYVPKGSSASGVTIGYGYDLGQQKTSEMRTMLASYFTQEQLIRLEKAVGLKGNDALAVIPSLRDITISKNEAFSLAMKMKSKYAQIVVNTYPEVLKTHPHCQGAMLSLVINRGTSFDKPTVESRAEMKNIHDDFVAGDLHDIPKQIRSMKRLWVGKGLDGLIMRREDEAKLFEEGLSQ